MFQGSLFEASGEFCTTWPTQGTWDRGFAYELPTLALPIDASGSSSSLDLLPTPAAYDTGRTLEQHRANKASLPGSPRTKITSLTVLAQAGFVQPDTPLLPTPGANDSTGGANEEMRGGGPGLRGIAKLLAGGSTRPPSLVGSEPLLGQPHSQLTIEVD
jgi:hypothetical protein